MTTQKLMTKEAIDQEIQKEVLIECIGSVIVTITRKSDLGQKDPEWESFVDLRNSLRLIPASEIDFITQHEKVKACRDKYENKMDNAKWQKMRKEWLRINGN